MQGNEIKKMNDGKVGAPFEYSQFVAFLKGGFKIGYRTVQGIVRGLSDYIRIKELHFAHLGYVTSDLALRNVFTYG